MNFNFENIKWKIINKYPFFASLIVNLKFSASTNTKTAMTNGKVVLYNEDFINSLSVDEQVFIFSHELCHIAFNHLKRLNGKDEKIWNIVTDAVINANLVNDGLIMPDVGGVYIPFAIHYDAEYLYDVFYKDLKNEEEKNVFNSLKKAYKNNKIDNHEMWNDEEFSDDDTITSNISEKDFFEENKQERNKRLNNFVDSLINEALSKKVADKKNIQISDIGHQKPIIDWRMYLKDATKAKVDWSFKNAVIENGVLIPNLEHTEDNETEILLDTSGSINTKLLKNFLRECKNILNVSKLKVGCFDTKFYGFHLIQTEKDIDNFPFMGGGGTDFDIAVNSFSSRAENKIVFTDGYANMPAKKIDAIWVVFGDEEIKPNGGKVIMINKNQLRKLKGYNYNLSDEFSM